MSTHAPPRGDEPTPTRDDVRDRATARTAIALVARREIRERGLSRPVIISTAITLIGLVLAIGLPGLLSDDERPRFELGVVGAAEAVEPLLVAIFDQLDADVDVTALADRDAAVVAVTDGDVEAVYLVADGVLLVEEEAGDLLTTAIDLVVRQQRLGAALAEAGVAPDAALALFADEGGVTVETLDERDADERDASLALAFVGAILLFISVTSNAGVILTATIEEKSSRVVEVLLGTLRPSHLLAGKLLGIGVVAIAQFALFVGVGLATAMLTAGFELPGGGAVAVAVSVVWFLLGFAFYATAYAVAGTLAGSLEDAQSTAAPMGFLLTGAYIVSLLVAAPNPASLPARVLGLVPPFTPMVMPVRMARTSVPWWEVAGAMVVMVVATVVVVRVAGRIYRAALLRGGGRLKLRDVWDAPS